MPSPGGGSGPSDRALTGAQKVALILMQMETDRAAEVMKQFTEMEAEEISAEIVRMRRVEDTVVDQTLSEFHRITMSGRLQKRGGKETALGLLEASFGAERAAGVMDRLASNLAGQSFDFLDDAEPGQVISLLEGELPQTIALVLAHLGPGQASAVLAGIDERVRTDVAQAFATMGSATPRPSASSPVCCASAPGPSCRRARASRSSVASRPWSTSSTARTSRPRRPCSRDSKPATRSSPRTSAPAC